MTRPPVALVLRALGLGDLLTAVPALRGVRRAWPGHELVLAAPEPLGAWAVDLGLVDATLAATPLAPVPLPGPPPDLALNLHGSGPQSHQVLLALRPARLVAFARPDLGVAGPDWRTDEHEVRRWCRLVDDTAGRTVCDPRDMLLAPPPRPSPAPGAVVVHPGASTAARRWPVERFAEVAATLHAEGHHVVVSGSAPERPLADRLAVAAGLPPAAVLAGALDLPDLHALVAGAALVLVGDTGVGHLATACATPSVRLFGPVDPARWGPSIDPHLHRVLWAGGPDYETNDGTGHELDPALDRLEVGDVLAAVRAQLRLASTAPEGRSAQPA